MLELVRNSDFRAICIQCFFSLSLLSFNSAFGQDAKERESRLFSNDSVTVSAAALDVIKDAKRADPIDVMAAAIRLFQNGDHESGVFWFYAGYVRAGYAAELVSSSKGIIVGYLLARRADIDAKAMLDINKMTAMLDRVVSWDESTLSDWAAQYSLDPTDPKFRGARKAALGHITELRQKLVADPEKYERQARGYKTLEQQMREKDEQRAADVSKFYTTATVNRAVGEHVLKIPANFFTPFGLRPGLVLPQEMPVTLLLPTLQPMSQENWRWSSSGNAPPMDRLLVTIFHKRGNFSHNRDNDGEQVERYFDDFVASSPPTEIEMWQDFYIYDHRRANLKLPLDGGSGYFRILGNNRDEDSFYLICNTGYDWPKKSTICNIYFLDHLHGFYLRSHLPVEYVPLWRDIRIAFRKLLEEWFDRTEKRANPAVHTDAAR
jgi:hypothetical protein